MEISYDPRYNIAYIRLRAEPGEVETLRLSESVHVDLGADGALVGIELLNANEQLEIQDGTPSLTLVDAAGARRELNLGPDSSTGPLDGAAAGVAREKPPRDARGPRTAGGRGRGRERKASLRS